MESPVVKKNFLPVIVLICSAILFNCSVNNKKIGNVYRYAMGLKIKGFDPILSGDVYSHIALKQIYEPLLQYHFLKRPYELEGCLAESFPDVSEDRLTYTFKLKKGVFFQVDPCFKGKKREMIASDIVYSIKRIADIKNKSTGWWIFDGRIKGLNEFRDKSIETENTDYSIPVSGLRASDKHTLIVTLTKPCPQLPYFFAMSYASVVAKEAVEYYKEEFLNHPVGTGPYKLVDWRKGLRVLYAKNEGYRKEYYPTEGEDGDRELGLLEDAGKQIPFIDTLVMNIIVEDQPMWLNFMQGNLEVSGVPKDNYNQAIGADRMLKKEMVDKGIILSINPSLDVTYTFFNMEDLVIGKKVHLRRAMAYAQDIEKSIDLLYNNRAIPAHSPIPPGLFGYDTSFVNPYQTYNPTLAKKELEKAGYPEGKGLPEFEYLTLDNTTSRQFTEKFVKEMSDVGISLSVSSVTWPEFLNRIKNKKYQIASMAWGADYPDPENFVQLLYGPNEAPGTNNANYKNAEYDSLYNALINTEDDDIRLKQLVRMKEIFVEDCPWIPGIHRLSFGLRYSWVKNYKYNDISLGDFKYKRVDIDARNNYFQSRK